MNTQQVIETLKDHVDHERDEVKNQREFLDYIQKEGCPIELIQDVQASIHAQEKSVTRAESVLVQMESEAEPKVLDEEEQPPETAPEEAEDTEEKEEKSE